MFMPSWLAAIHWGSFPHTAQLGAWLPTTPITSFTRHEMPTWGTKRLWNRSPEIRLIYAHIGNWHRMSNIFTFQYITKRDIALKKTCDNYRVWLCFIFIFRFSPQRGTSIIEAIWQERPFVFSFISIQIRKYSWSCRSQTIICCNTMFHLVYLTLNNDSVNNIGINFNT